MTIEAGELDRLVEQGELEQALKLAARLAPQWLDDGRLAEGRARLAELLTTGEPDRPSTGRARALAAAGLLAFRAGDSDEAARLHEEALDAARQVGDRESEARALGGLARVALRRQDFADVRSRAKAAVAIWRELGDDAGLARTLHLLPYVDYMEGNDDLARAGFEESLELARRLGERDLAAGELTNLCSVETRAGNLEHAEELGRESLRLARELGSEYLLPYCVVNLGGMHVARGEAQRGTRVLAAGKAMFDRAGMAIDPGTAIEFERHVERARAALGDAFASAWDDGYALDERQAFDQALR